MKVLIKMSLTPVQEDNCLLKLMIEVKVREYYNCRHMVELNFTFPSHLMLKIGPNQELK